MNDVDCEMAGGVRKADCRVDGEDLKARPAPRSKIAADMAPPGDDGFSLLWLAGRIY
jgi:hypothetical protein